MTQKPVSGEDNQENSSPNGPETNEENFQERIHDDKQLIPKFYVGQQLDILDSVHYWTEAEAEFMSTMFSNIL